MATTLSIPPVLPNESFALILTTPNDCNDGMTRENVTEELDKAKNSAGFDSNDKIRQLEAITALDVSARLGGLMEHAAMTTTAKGLIIVAAKDRAV